MARADLVGRLLQSLEQKRQKMASDMVRTVATYDKYLEIRGRCLELDDVISEIRQAFQGTED